MTPSVSRRSCLLPIVLLGLAAAAHAQPASHPFFPLAEGNVWVYDLYNAEAYRSITVLDWDGNGDDTWWRVAVAQEPFSGSTPTTAECALRIVEVGGQPTIESEPLEGNESLCASLSLPAPLPSSGMSQTVWLTGQSYSLDVASTSFFNPQFPVPTHCTLLIEGMGILARRVCSGFFGGGGALTERLVYAEVGGTSYGQLPAAYHAAHDPMDYTPLAVGNEWTYQFMRSETGGPPLVFVLQYTITGFIEATGRFTLELKRFLNGEVVSTDACLIWNDPIGRVRLSGASTCQLGTAPSPEAPWSYRLIGATAVQPTTIGETTYTLNTVSFSKAAPRDNPYDNHVSTAHQGAHGIGLLYFDYSYSNPSANYISRRTYTLLYARIGEVEYGQNPVSSEPTSPAAASTDVALFPNPVQSTARLRMAAHPSERTVEVFDVLGRRWVREALAEGESEFRLDLSGLAPGTYLLRVYAGASEVHTRRFTVVR